MAGGTGFTGRRVVERLVRAGRRPRCLVRATSDPSVLPEAASRHVGDLADTTSCREWLAGCEALVYVASMGFGHVPGVLEACRDAGVTRAVFVSTTAIFTRLPAPSKAVRTAAEEAVRQSGLRWTLVRPTMIYGAPGDRNMERLLRAVVRWPVLPVPGRGDRLIQPVHVDDLADAIVAAHLRAEAAADTAYDVSGAAPLSFVETLRTAGAAVGRTPRLVRIPLGPVCATLGALEAIGLTPPVKREQVLRLAEDKAFSHAAAARDLGFRPRTFEDGIREEARLLGLAESGA